jgi:hypothetical protein
MARPFVASLVITIERRLGNTLPLANGGEAA